MTAPLTADQLRPFVARANMKKAAIILAAVCAVLGSLGFLDDTASLGLKLGLAIPFGALSLVLLFAGLRPPTKHPFIAAVRNRYPEIVWIYVTEQTVNNQHANTFLNVGLTDGKSYSLTIGKDSPDRYIRHLQSIAPQAAVGFSTERKAEFKRDPSSLRAR